MRSDSTPFSSVHVALQYYLHHNPARMKSVNLFEVDRRRGTLESLTNIDKWNAVALSLKAVLGGRFHGTRAARIFVAYRLVPPDRERPHMSEVAKRFRVSTTTAYDDCHQVTDALERDMVDRRLIPNLDAQERKILQ